MATRMQITQNGDVFVIRFQDRRLAGDLPDQLGDELYRLAAEEDCTKILLNFSGVEFFASDMLGKVMALNKRMKQKKGRLAICEVCPYLHQVITVTRLDTLLTIAGTEAEGLSALA